MRPPSSSYPLSFSPESLAMGYRIYESSLASLTNTTVDISFAATPGRYRLINCARYIEEGVLCIEEFTDLSTTTYSAISYLWRGNPIDPSRTDESSGAFSVKGAEDGDPVNIEVLSHACTASLLESADYLWLDRLCIIQTNRDDKAWQIQRMYGIYQCCKTCLILPGGIGQLVTIEDETEWITRAWTLQEATAPSRSLVLFAWEGSPGRWEGWEGGVKGTVIDVVPEKSAVVLLRDMLNACFYPMALTWHPADGSPSRDDLSPSILGSYGDSALGSLMWALDAEDSESQSVAVWRCALLRASSRPVDMVLSIMGIFGIALDARLFHKDDRIGATIALAREILCNGGKPAWLAISLDIPPSRVLSAFPEFPHTDVTGEVAWQASSDNDETSSAALTVLPEDWVRDIPGGSMDEEGYLTITNKAAPVLFTGQSYDKRHTTFARNNNDIDVVPTSGVLRVTSTDGKVWDISISKEVPSHDERLGQTFVLFLGSTCKFPRDPVYQPAPPLGGITLPETSPLRAVILEEHQPERFHRTSVLTLPEEPFRSIIDSWRVYTFAIGGPEPLRGSAL
ncbi:hypothetical protein VKT23_011164 [Stygiomarasmius scandens]|uniref:Heterokaryon incompatibility domain-containing protein n=1 Tax=Marasmiellus scandens TaxID=2682957 RepID=A0ABR1JA07_9AGAR